jgi:hypothetical protein
VVTNNVVRYRGIGGDPIGVGIWCRKCTVIGNVVNNSGLFGLYDETGTTGYKDNQFSDNNGGNANPQVFGGIEIGTNICGGDTTCP